MSKTRMGKRVASLLLSLVMMLSLLPTTVYATGDTGETTDEIVGQATTSGDNTEGTGEPEPTGEGEDGGTANVSESEDGAATNDAVVEETIAPVNAEGVDAVANAESSGDKVSGEDGNELVNFVTVNGVDYATLEAAIGAATPDANSVITYTINGKVEIGNSDEKTNEQWISVVGAKAAGTSSVKFVGNSEDAEISLEGMYALLANQGNDLDVSFENLKLSHPGGAYKSGNGSVGHMTNYFACVLRNTNAAENTVTYTNCTFPNGVCNNQYGKTVFDNCQFTNATPGLYNLWVYGGNVELNGGTFTGVRGAKVYTEGNTQAKTPMTVDIKGTSFEGLTEKAAIVVSKAAAVTLTNVSATDCNKGLFQKAIEGSSNEEEVVIAPSGTNVSGTFVVDGNKGVSEADKRNFNISAGTFTSKVSNDYCANGFEVKANADGTTYGVVKAATAAAAQIGETTYGTLADAIVAAQDGQTVTLLTNVNENVEIAAGKNLTLDLNGKTLNGGTGTAKAALRNLGTITIRDTSTAKTGTIKRDDKGITGETSYYVIDNQGTMTIESGTVRNNSGYRKTNPSGSMVGSSLIRNGDDTAATLNITGGTLEQKNFIAIKNGSLGTLNVSGGTISSDHSAIQNWFKADITGGKINGQLWTDAYIAGESVGETKIGGDATFTGEIVMDVTGSSVVPALEINGGNLDVTNWRITKAAADAGAKPAVSGGTFKAAVPENYCAEGFIPTKNEDGSYGVKAGAYVAQIGEVKYATLADAIAAAEAGQTVTLLANTTEDVIINKNITLDLGGKTLTNTNADKATISVSNGATATVKNGSVMGGTSYYNIEVTKGSNANLTLEDVTATAGNTDSSMIDNWGTLTINSGTYTGGLNVVKSEEGSKLTITGGTFTLEYATNGYTGVVFAYGDTTISGGEFTQNLTTTGRWNHPQVVATGVVEGYEAITRVSGGHFVNKMSGEGIFRGVGKGTSDNFEVSGGTFNKSVSDSFFKEGYFAQKNTDGTYGVGGPAVAKVNSAEGYNTLDEAIAAAKAGDTVTLLQNVTVDKPISVDKAITLDLGGKTLTSTWAMPSDASGADRYALVNNAKVTLTNGTFAAGQARAIGAYAGLTLNSVTVSQTLTGGHACVAFCKAGATYTIKSSTITGDYAVANFANNATISITNSTKLNGTTCGLYHNGSNYGLKLTVTNTTINGSLDGTIGNENDPSGVYISGSASHGTMQKATFTNCTIKGATAIEVKYTDLTLNKCTVEATVKTPSYDKNNNGMTALGFAVVSTDNSKDGVTPVPAGTVTIKGKGNYTGLVGLGALKSVKETYKDFADGTIKVSGGTFSSAVMPEYCAEDYVPTQNEDGTYGVREANYVAQVLDKNGNPVGVKYETLQAAIDAASKNATVKLLADTKENVTIDKALTLDLNGHILNGGTEKGKPALTITARIVKIKDSSEAQTGTIMREDTAENSGVSSHYVIDIQGNAWVMFESGNVKNGSGVVGVKGASLVRVGDDSVEENPGLVINGGTFTQDNFIVIKVDRGYLKLNGGTLNSLNTYAVENWSSAIIKGGTVNGAVAAWTYSDGTNSFLTIEGGTVNGDVTSVNYGNAEGKTATVTITGGTFTGKLDTRSYDPKTGELTSIVDAAKATIKVSGGTFNNAVEARYCDEGYTPVQISDGKYGVQQQQQVLAKIGDTAYYTMYEAFHAVQANETIVMQRDYTTGAEQYSGNKSFTIDLNGKTWTYTGTNTNHAAFEINHSDVTLTVKNGTVVSNSMVGLIPSVIGVGGTITYDNAGLVFEGVTMTANGHSGIETNGSNTSDTVTLKNSTLDVPNGFGIYFPSSGTLTIDNSTITAKTMGVQVCAGSLSISGDQTAITVSGDGIEKTGNDGAIQDGAAISIVNRTGYKGLDKIEVTGGTFTAKPGNAAIKAYNWANNTESEFTANDKVFVSGGTFSSAVPEGLCAEGYIPTTNSDGTHTVKKGQYVAQVGNVKYESLAAAIGAAQDGDTVTLLKDIDLPATAVVEGKTITLDLNGKTLANTADIWEKDATYDWSLISVREGGNLTINGSGALRAKENDCYALDVQDGGNLTVNGDASYVGNIHAIYVQKGTATVNGGSYSVQQKYPDAAKADEFVLNCYDANRANGTTKIIVNGGTFTNFDPRNNKAEGTGTSFVAEGVGVNYENGTFTATPDMAAQIVDAGGGSVAAYAGHYDAIAAAKDGETVILLSDRKNFVTNTINANITIDLNGKTLSVGNNNPFFRTNGEVTIQNGTIESNSACAIVNAYNKLTLKNVKITGVTGDSGKNLVNVCSNAEVTIDKDTVLTASGSGVAVFIGQAADAKYTLNVYGKVIQQKKSYAISGNGSYEGATTINIYEGAEVRSASVAIYHPQAGEINVYGGLVEGYCGIGIKSGTLNITGGQVLGVGDDDELSDKNSNPNGMTYDGSAIIIDSRAAYAGNVKINISGDALVQSSYSTAIREIGESAETTNVTALNVTGGKVLGASGKAAIQLHGVTADVTSISGGTFSSKVPAEYCAPGYVPTGEDADGRFTVKEGEFTVQVTSDTTTGTGSMATVSGGGKGSINSAVEVSAPAVSGYTFVGWYLNSYNGKKLSDQPKYTYKPTADCTLVAVYEPISGGTFKLTVDGQGINVNNVAQGNHYLAYLAVGSEITLECTNDNFMFWVNSSDNIVSTNKVLTITLVGDSAYRAVTADNGNDFALVIFKNTQSSGGQELSAAHYTSESTISFPANPSLYGRTFKNWAFMDATNTVATESAIRERIKAGEMSIIVVPVFEATGTYAVTVQYVNKADTEIADPTVSKSEPTGAMIKVEAKEIEGCYFSHWTDESGEVVLSTKQTYVVCAVTNTTIKAVYVTNESDKEQAADKVTLTTNASRNGAKWRVTLVMNYAITDDHTILQRGFLYWPTNTDLSVEKKEYLKYREWDSETSSNNGATVLNLNTSNPDKMIYARAYVIVKDASGNQQTIYSKPIAVSYNIITGATGN